MRGRKRISQHVSRNHEFVLHHDHARVTKNAPSTPQQVARSAADERAREKADDAARVGIAEERQARSLARAVAAEAPERRQKDSGVLVVVVAWTSETRSWLLARGGRVCGQRESECTCVCSSLAMTACHSLFWMLVTLRHAASMCVCVTLGV